MTITQRILGILKKSLRYVWLSILAILEIPLVLILEVWPVTTIGFFIKDNFKGLWDWLMSKKFIRNVISKGIFRRFGNVTKARPHQMTMIENYTSWKSITDLTITGRHLPEDENFDTRIRPPSEQVVDLFLRQNDGSQGGIMTPDIRSSLLFASFAQWFTDSFLRTSHAFEFDPKKKFAVKTDNNGVPIRKEGREKYNNSTHEIDLCQIYGLNKKMTDKLRCPDNKGCLRSQHINGEEYPETLLASADVVNGEPLPIKKHFEDLHHEPILRHIFGSTEQGRYETLFATGLEHSNSTIGNALLNTVFLRLHNKIARKTAEQNKDWDSDQVFESARNTAIVILLNIVISDYIAHISPLNLPLKFQPGLAEEQTWYRRNRIHIEFNILYRWHGLVPSKFSFLPDDDNASNFRHNNNWLIEQGLSKAVTLFSNEPVGKMIMGNTPRFLEGVKYDTMTIMRASKLQNYNSYRNRFNLPEAEDFTDVSDDPDMVKTLSEMYGAKIENLEWYVGMCAESHNRGMIMGDLMLNMVAHDAFTHALTNPLLSNEIFVEKTFGQVGWDYVNRVTTLKQVIAEVVETPGTICEFAINGEHLDRAPI
ncbi:MAG: peroxidase family protein [Hyphomicrobiales bacterium]